MKMFSRLDCDDPLFACQIVMTRNKEAVLSEKDLSCHLGQTCLVGYADPIDPSQQDSFEGFMTAVQKAWDAEWTRVYSAPLSGAPPSPSITRCRAGFEH